MLRVPAEVTSHREDRHRSSVLRVLGISPPAGISPSLAPAQHAFAQIAIEIAGQSDGRAARAGNPIEIRRRFVKTQRRRAAKQEMPADSSGNQGALEDRARPTAFACQWAVRDSNP